MTCKDCDKHEVCKRIDYELEYHNKSINEAEAELAPKCRLFKNKAENAEKKHGKWLDEGDGDWRCSLCRAIFTFDAYGDVHPRDDCGCNYCPTCGAKMDEKEGAEG